MRKMVSWNLSYSLDAKEKMYSIAMSSFFRLICRAVLGVAVPSKV